jgi:urea transport system substrate-binding protein
VGVLQVLSGPWASTSAPLVEATEFAINEINEQGGILGSRIEPILVDGSTNESALPGGANRLILENHVCALFACCSPAGRKQVLPVVEKHNYLLFYSLPCEGLEQSPNIVYVGATPNQHLLPGLQSALGTLHKSRLFLVDSDNVYSRSAHAILGDAPSQALGTGMVGEVLFPLGSSDVKEAVEKIKASNADLILNTISGDTNVAFFRALRAARVTPDKVPTLSFCMDENQLRSLSVEVMIGDYAIWNYVQSLNRPENAAFIRNFRARASSHRLVTDSMESAYVAVHLWGRAVKEANDSTAAIVRPALRGLEINGPGGPVRIDKASQYAWKVVRIGQIGERGLFKIVSSSDEPVAPQPFPLSRSREQWLQFLDGLQRDYGGRWER